MAARLWLRLSPEARAGTALLVPTRAFRAEVEEAVREGLEAEGALGGRSVEIATLVPLNLTRAEAGDPRNWREGDLALFNRDMVLYRIRKDDAYTVTEVEDGATAREAAAAFDALAREAQAAGEEALSAGAEENASELGLAAQHWRYKLASRRFAVARLAERDPVRRLPAGAHTTATASTPGCLRASVLASSRPVSPHRPSAIRRLRTFPSAPLASALTTRDFPRTAGYGPRTPSGPRPGRATAELQLARTHRLTASKINEM